MSDVEGLMKTKSPRYSIHRTWNLFNATEKRNITTYIAGIMLYKFGLEAFNGSLVALATNRYDIDAERRGVTPYTFERVGMLTGLFQAFQCVGSILIAPLMKRIPTKIILSWAIFVFGIFTAILLIVDAATGGKIKPRGWDETYNSADANFYGYYGSYNTDGIIPIYCVCGIAYGMVELIRRVIPRDIVGGDVQKLRRMDSFVHIFYELAGTAGAFCTALGLIPYFGNNMSFIITPICFTFASITWFFISHLDWKPSDNSLMANQPAYVKAVLGGFYLFVESAWVGGKILFTSRKFIWLLPGYSLALYGHRYLENGVAPVIAKRYLGDAAWSQIIVGGSNIGELLGALFVFLFTNLVKTPILWLRLDVLMLLIPWYLVFWWVPSGHVSDAWRVAATFIPISFGWAAGDVSLTAHVQALLGREEKEVNDVSPLGAVMSFLYCTYIVMYAIAGTFLGRYVDAVGNRPENQNTGTPPNYPGFPNDYVNVRPAIYNVVGVQFTVLAVIMLLATFIPTGALAFNPTNLYGEALETHDSQEELVTCAGRKSGARFERKVNTETSSI